MPCTSEHLSDHLYRMFCLCLPVISSHCLYLHHLCKLKTCSCIFAFESHHWLAASKLYCTGDAIAQAPWLPWWTAWLREVPRLWSLKLHHPMNLLWHNNLTRPQSRKSDPSTRCPLQPSRVWGKKTDISDWDSGMAWHFRISFFLKQKKKILHHSAYRQSFRSFL